MNVKWLLDRGLLESSTHVDIEAILKKLGHEYTIDQYKYFSSKPENIHYKDSDCVILYGSIPFVRQYSNGRDFIPGIYLRDERFACTGYMHNIPSEYLLNSDYVFTTFKDFINRKDFFYGIFETNELFLRPNSGMKVFTGLSINNDNFDYEINSLISLTSVSESTLVMVSSCKDITKEYRYFIVDGKVITGSQYMERGEISVKKELSDDTDNLAWKIASLKFPPDIVYACDIAIHDGVPKVVELNSFSCSGFYACDAEKLLDAVAYIAHKEWNGEIFINA